MFKIATTGFFRRRQRLVARELLTSDDFRAIARELRVDPMIANKTGFVAATQAVSNVAIETRWEGHESRDNAAPGDWVVTSLSPAKQVLRDASGSANTYVVRAAKFPELYSLDDGSTEYGLIYKHNDIPVKAIYLSGGFDILASWGPETAPDGYLLLAGAEVYGNNRATFEASYEVIG